MFSRAVLIGRARHRTNPSGRVRQVLYKASRGDSLSFEAYPLCACQGARSRREPIGEPPVRPAAMEEGTHPDPSRTRKLSLPSPMVLRSSPWESRTPLAAPGALCMPEWPMAIPAFFFSRHVLLTMIHTLLPMRGNFPFF